MDEVPVGADVVVRALPGAASASSRELDRQVRSGLARLGLVETARRPG
ncbi:ribonuclease P [Rhodococcus ruber BKS 20-38]|uniref:Ribonuclease P n=1 Tax=Rhodococcus ruber BKS 20-38 TaxID=1278076 RepID=M2ZUL9_9NOCA|nr:ribonuclease P [Rhodococcus ruber BKS 20-38]